MKRKWITGLLAVMITTSMTACGLIGDNYEPMGDMSVVVVEPGKKESESADFWSDHQEQEEAAEETLPKIIIAAEVGQMDDEEDPQLSQEMETGAAVDFEEMIAQVQASSEAAMEETTTRGTAIEVETTIQEKTEEASSEQLIEPSTKETEMSGSAAEETKKEETKAEETLPSVTESSSASQAAEGLSYGIDVSKWQEKIDWKKVKDAGIEFAIVRVGYRTQKTGVIFEDPYARYNLQEASKAGIKLGAYFFSTATTKEEALEEAAWLCSVIDSYPITYPVVYNCEGFRGSGSRQYSMTKEQRSDMAITFLDYVKERGYQPMFYAAKNELTDSSDWDTERLSSRYPIWVSQYPTVPYPETPNSSYAGEHAMWQYTSQGSVSGISKPVDVNVAYFKMEQTASSKAEVGPGVAVDSPELGIVFTEVSETVTAKIATNLRTVPSTASADTVVYKLMNGETITRTGIGDNGWSRVDYHGQSLYAVSSYLTTELPENANPVTTRSDGPGSADSSAETAGPGAALETEATENAPASENGDDGIYEPVQEEVTAKNRTNLRSKPGSDYADTIVDTLEHGEVATRIGIGSNGWSKVEFEGQILYAVSSYLTTDLEGEAQQEVVLATEPGLADFPKLTFQDVREEVTAKIETNLRTEPSTRSDDTVVTKLMHGDVALRTGLGSNGWSRVEYDGQVLYAVTSYLMTVPQ